MESIPYRIEYYTDDQGQKPFRDWLLGLRDQTAVVRIRARLVRVRSGNFGSSRFVGDGVAELKVDHGPGYRVYYGMDGNKIVLLLCGGDKRTQKQDIETAKRFWRNQRERKK